MKKLFVLASFLITTFMCYAQDQTVNGSLLINPKTNYNYNQGIRICESPNNWSLVMLGAIGAEGTNENSWILGRSNTLNFVISRNSPTGLNAMVITKSGNVGFGTNSPQSKLDVRGKIIADEVQIQVNKGADFVFDPDYNLKDLSEVEDFVKENKHLPEIPSEKEMQENGLNINDMQIKLLQKIEELTLYVIEQDKKIQELQNKLESKD